MKLPRRNFLQLGAGAAALPAGSGLAGADAYPTRPVRVIVPYAPGGPTDLFGRLIAQKLSEHLGKQFYVENIGGANGNVGMGRAAKSAADGYTILVVSPSYTTNPALYNNESMRAWRLLEGLRKNHRSWIDSKVCFPRFTTPPIRLD